MVQIGIFLPNQFAAALATTLHDYLCTANLVAEKPLFSVQFLARTKSIDSYSGIQYKAQTEIPTDLDLLIVVGTGGSSKKQIFENLKTQSAYIQDVIHAAKKNGAQIATVCTAAYYLAGSGLLKGKSATTAWWLIDEMRAEFPDIHWEEKKTLISQGKLITAGAGFSGIELAKLILTKFKLSSLERKVHRILLLPERPVEQHPYVALTQSISSEFSRKLQSLLEQNDTPLSLDDLASNMGMAPRTFMRKFKAQMKMTPGKWLQLKRVEKAKHLLMTRDITVEETCYQVGYEDPSSFIRLFQREVGVSPGEFRLTFRK
ncbi:MAG: GlxA family transcriptional regulator [Pseudobdellovibrionaceae bacterium]